MIKVLLLAFCFFLVSDEIRIIAASHFHQFQITQTDDTASRLVPYSPLASELFGPPPFALTGVIPPCPAGPTAVTGRASGHCHPTRNIRKANIPADPSKSPSYFLNHPNKNQETHYLSHYRQHIRSLLIFYRPLDGDTETFQHQQTENRTKKPEGNPETQVARHNISKNFKFRSKKNRWSIGVKC